MQVAVADAAVGEDVLDVGRDVVGDDVVPAVEHRGGFRGAEQRQRAAGAHADLQVFVVSCRVGDTHDVIG